MRFPWPLPKCAERAKDMERFHILIARLRALVRRDAVIEDIEEEMLFHVEMETRSNIARGMKPDEARASAFRSFGNLGRIRELAFEIRGGGIMDTLWQDLRYSARMLLKRPGFTIAAVLTLALGIGANTTIFSLINTVMLRPLPVDRPSEIMALNNVSEDHAFPSFSYPNYKDFRDRNDTFSGLVGYRYTPLNLSHDGVNERLWGYQVTGNYFDVLGVRAALGRAISPEDDTTPGAHPVTVISYKCWRQRFGGEPSVIGKTVIVNGGGYTIIGVAPPGFTGTEVISSPDLWFPVAMQAQLDAGDRWLDKRGTEDIFVQGRLKPGVTVARAQADLDSIATQLEREYPDDNEGKQVLLSAPGLLGTMMRGPVLGFAGLLMAIVGIVLLLACTNLTNLLLARATERRREIAVRLALGASRFRLIRQLLTESSLLALAGGALGLFPAIWLVNIANAIKMPVNIPVSIEIHVDYRVYLFAFLISLATGVLFGLLPALQATKTDLAPALKDEGTFASHRGSWLKNTLIVLQVALSLVLLVGGGLMIRALQEARTIELGFDPRHANEVSFDLRLQGYESSRGRQFEKRLLERVRTLPGVTSAGIANVTPVDLHFSRTTVFIEGKSVTRTSSTPIAMYNRATPGYFQAMSTRLMEGRDFTEQDDEQSQQVAIVNETFARRFFPGESALGKRFRLRDPESTLTEIIGVVQDGKYGNLNEGERPYVCRPLWQSGLGSATVIVRTDDEPQKLIAAVRDEVQQLDPNLPVSSGPLGEKLSLTLLPARIAASLLSGFGLLALMLAGIGIYGVISYAVSARTHEIGIRMALGADKKDVMKLVLGQMVTLILIAVVLGLSAALAVTRLAKSLLFGVSATDLATFVVTSLLLGAVALLACYLPARRATKVDPMVALRYE